VKERENAPQTVDGGQVEVGHAVSDQRVSLTEIVVNVQTRHHGEVLFARFVPPHQFAHRLAQGRDSARRARLPSEAVLFTAGLFAHRANAPESVQRMPAPFLEI
jgi:hypothetical protein